MQPDQSRTARQTALFWLTATATVIVGYWFCLRFLFPGYFEPLSAFHVDFYDYAAARVHSYSILFTRYSRPASYAVAKFLSDFGFQGLLIGEITVALLSVLATLAVARRALGVYSRWAPAFFALYTIVLFAHPEFYWVHRHDLAAETAYLFLMLSLLAWLWFLDRRRTIGLSLRVILIGSAVLFAFMSAFSKETYFVTALCLVAGFAVSSRTDLRLHAGFFVLLVFLDAGSYAWNRHIGWPPAGSAADYKVSLAPLDLIRTYNYYLYNLVNPAFIVLPLIGLAAVWRDRSRLIAGFAFLLAGLAAFIPHAILPNHLDAEYAWLAAPLFLAPMLLVGEPMQGRRSVLLSFALTGMTTVLAVIGPGGYRATYHTPQEQWFVNEDRKGSAMVRSLRQLHSIRGPARVLVTGLEDTAIPWESEDFIRSEFSGDFFWSVVLPESIDYRRSSRTAEFPHAGDVKLENFDRVVTYDSSGHLVGIRPVAAIPVSEPLGAIVVPSLVPLLAESREHPHDPRLVVACAQTCLEWGLWKDAQNFLSQAERNGAPDRITGNLTAAIQTAIAQSTAQSREVALIVRPAKIIEPDGSGLGEVELSWTVPEGVASELRINAPDGKLFTGSVGSGHARTGKWVNDGMQFFLQDVGGGKPLTSEHTLARVKVVVSR